MSMRTDTALVLCCASSLGYTIEQVGKRYRLRNEQGDVVMGVGDTWRHLFQYDPLNKSEHAMELFWNLAQRSTGRAEFNNGRFTYHDYELSAEWDFEINEPKDLYRGVVQITAEIYAEEQK